MRDHCFPDSTPSNHRQAEKNPCDNAGYPVATMQKAESY
jgi:hypothetical protein